MSSSIDYVTFSNENEYTFQVFSDMKDIATAQVSFDADKRTMSISAMNDDDTQRVPYGQIAMPKGALLDESKVTMDGDAKRELRITVPRVK